MMIDRGMEDLEVGGGILGDLVVKEGGGIHDERREFRAKVIAFVCLKD